MRTEPGTSHATPRALAKQIYLRKEHLRLDGGHLQRRRVDHHRYRNPLVYHSAAATLTPSLSLSNNQFTVGITGVPGYKYSIQASTSRLDRTTLQTNASQPSSPTPSSTRPRIVFTA